MVYSGSGVGKDRSKIFNTTFYLLLFQNVYIANTTSVATCRELLYLHSAPNILKSGDSSGVECDVAKNMSNFYV